MYYCWMNDFSFSNTNKIFIYLCSWFPQILLLSKFFSLLFSMINRYQLVTKRYFYKTKLFEFNKALFWRWHPKTCLKIFKTEPIFTTTWKRIWVEFLDFIGYSTPLSKIVITLGKKWIQSIIFPTFIFLQFLFNL